MSNALLHTYARAPVTFVRGEGARLWDDAGNEYLDFLCGISVTSLGHCHPKVVEAVRDQAGTLMHTSNLFFNQPMADLAQRISQSSLGGGVFLCNSGAEANEAAFKLARKHRQGGEVLSVHGAFHGRTYGALSATPQESKQAPFAPLVGGFRAVAPEQLAASIGPDTAAVILEPIRGETGIHEFPADELGVVRAACDAHDAVLIFDEIQTGMGRTGTLWCYEQLGVRPDAMTTAKALGGGLPIGALVVDAKLDHVLAPGDHGTTFGGNPVAARAALAAFDVTDDPDLLARVRDLGERLRAALAQLPGVSEVRGRGLMVAFDLADGGAPGFARQALLEHRLVVNATGPQTIRLEPPLTISEAEIADAVGRVRALL